mgnify:CR=1 FL=1
MLVGSKNYRTIEASADQSYVKIIDQTRLPFKLKIIHLKTLGDVIKAIKIMQVRGAPLIGVTAAYGFALSMNFDNSINALRKCKKDLIDARPTAINLSWAVNQIYDALINASSEKRVRLSWELANNLANEDIEKNISIGMHGYNLFKAFNEKTINILTHCNAGWLATVDYGTALSPIFKLFDEGFDVHVWVDETRPRNQGLSLTAWELSQYKIRHTVVTDNAGGLLMKEGLVDFVIVGADRIALDGQVCNKIGTYLKAVVAKENNIPFYVAAPISTIDPKFSGESRNFEIECRDPNEIMSMKGEDKLGNIIEISLGNSPAYNPAFDITPSRYVSKFICERGVFDTDEIRGIVKP